MKSPRAFLYLIPAALIWGATVPIMKYTLQEVPLFSLIFLRMFLASMIILPFVLKKLKIQKEDYKNIFLSAFFGTNLNLLLFFFGLKNTHAINASVLIATTPIFTIIFAHIFLKEKVSMKLILGSSLALLGTILIVGAPALQLDIKSSIGSLALLGSSLAWVGHEIVSKRILPKYGPMAIAFFTTFIGGVLFSPLAAFEFIKNPSWFTNLSILGFLGLLFGIVFASFTAYTLWQKGLNETTAGEASFIFYITPLSGVLFSILLLGEKFTSILFLGSILIIGGIILAEYHKRKRALHS